jgi:hypothetical protein
MAMARHRFKSGESNFVPIRIDKKVQVEMHDKRLFLFGFYIFAPN